MIQIRVLPADRLSVIGEIDRSEHVGTIFEMHAGDLTSHPVDIDVPRWNPDGGGPNTVMSFIDDLRPILERGATLLAAFIQDAVAGVAIIEERFEGDMAWLAFLHVSNGHRRHGVGSALWTEAVNRARVARARSIYVSATPSGSAVGFYLAHGCTVATVPHHELFAAEPEDVHLLAAIVMLAEGSALDWSATYLTSDLGATTAVAALAYGAFSVTMAIGRFTGDAINKRVGRIRLVQIGAALATIGLGLGLLLSTPLSVIIGFAVMGAGLANIIPVIFTTSAEQGTTPADGISATATLGYLGFLAGPPLIGAIAELTNLTVGLATVVILLGVVTASSTALAKSHAPQPATN